MKKECDPLINFVSKIEHSEIARKYFFEAVDFTLKYRNLDYKEYLPELSNLIMQN